MERALQALVQALMPSMPRKITEEALEVFWLEGFRTGFLMTSAFWLSVVVVYLLFSRRPRP